VRCVEGGRGLSAEGAHREAAGGDDASAGEEGWGDTDIQTETCGQTDRC